MDVHIGYKITDLRKKNNLTQENLSEKINLSVKTISRLENDGEILRADIILLIYELFGITPNELLGIEKTTNQDLYLLKQELGKVMEILEKLTPDS